MATKKWLLLIALLFFLGQRVSVQAMPEHFELVATNVYGEEALIIYVDGEDITIVKDLAYVDEEGQKLLAGTLKVEIERPFSVIGDYVEPPSIDKNVVFPGYYKYADLFCRIGTNTLRGVNLVSDSRIQFFKSFPWNKNVADLSIGSPPPDLCLVLVDSLRADHLGCYGYERETSPAVGAFGVATNLFSKEIVHTNETVSPTPR